MSELKPGWKMVKFGDVVKNANLVERDPEANGVERIVGLEHIDPENLHIRRWNSVGDGTSFTRKFVPGQTLFGKRRAYQRKVAYAEFEGICSGDILTFETNDKSVLLPELLPFICQSDAFFDHALGTSAGSLSPRTSWTALKDFEFPLPPLDEQKRIAEILWAADEAVEKWKFTLVQQVNLRDAALKDIFRCDVSGNTVESHKGSSAICKIHEVAKVFSGGTPSRKNKSFWEGGEIPWIKTGEVNYYDIRDTGEKITPIAVEKSAAKMVPPDTVLVAMYGQGPTRGRVGYTVIEASINQACAAIVVNKNVLRSRYVYYYLSKEYENIRSMGHGAAQPNINAGMIKNFAIPTPSLEKQDEALTLISGINTRIQEIRSHIECLNNTVKALGNSVIGAAHV